MSSQDPFAACGGTNVMHLLHDMETSISDYDVADDFALKQQQEEEDEQQQQSPSSTNKGLKRKVSEQEDKDEQIEQGAAPNAITAFLQNQLDGAGSSLVSSSSSSSEQQEQLQQQLRYKKRGRRVSGGTLTESMESPIFPLSTEIESMADMEPLPLDHQQQHSQRQPPLRRVSRHPSPTAGASATDAAFDHQGDAKRYLHRVCHHFSSQKGVVEIALAFDPEAVRRKSTGITAPSASFSHKGQAESHQTAPITERSARYRIIQERYSYPINIALQNYASKEVLGLLVNQGPDVLVEKDGYERTGSLSIVLCHKPKDLDLVDMILFANPQGIMVTDRKLNYPLHTACAKAASAEVIQRLYTHYPAALFQQNFDSETPMDIARRNTLTEEASLNFLQEQYNQGCLKLARNHAGEATPTPA